MMLKLKMVPLYVAIGIFLTIPLGMAVEAKLASAVERGTQTVLDTGKIVLDLR